MWFLPLSITLEMKRTRKGWQSFSGSSSSSSKRVPASASIHSCTVDAFRSNFKVSATLSSQIDLAGWPLG